MNPYEKYGYLILSLIFLVVWVFIYFTRPDLKKKLVKVSILGGLAGLIAEIWYYKDYWSPPTIFGQGKISIEDFIFGFAILGVSTTIYDVIFRKTNIPGEKNRRILFWSFFGLGILSLIIFNSIIKINSIIVSELMFMIFAVIMLFIRKDLIKPSLFSGAFLSLIALVIYGLLLKNSPMYLEKYWLINSTSLGVILPFNIPLTEITWYLSWGLLAGIADEFSLGKIKADLPK